ncbi:MAG: oligosaccharide flippase family protein, partial [Nitrososphaerales archaeon]
AMGWMCWKSFPPFRRLGFRLQVLPELMAFGGWMTVSNVISPLMVQMDRFVIGAMLSLAAVAYYATPFEMVTKLLMIPTAITGVAFPAFARLLAQQDFDAAGKLYWRSMRLIALGILLPVLILALFAEDVLRLWLHGAFPAESATVLRILVLGVFVNGLAHVPFAYLQGAKRADLTARIHLAEAPLYLLALALAVPRFGIVGAATAWTLRVTLDALAMHVGSSALGARLLRAQRPAVARTP